MTEQHRATITDIESGDHETLEATDAATLRTLIKQSVDPLVRAHHEVRVDIHPVEFVTAAGPAPGPYEVEN